VSIASNCTEGYRYNWCNYIAHEFLLDCKEAQERNLNFHYSWLLVLIALVAWKEPPEAQFVDISPYTPATARYASLWFSTNKERQQVMNDVFACYLSVIYQEVRRTPRLSHELYNQYFPVAKFKADMHNVFIQARRDKKHNWWRFPFIVTEEDILEVVQRWPDAWMEESAEKIDIHVPLSRDLGASSSHPPTIPSTPAVPTQHVPGSAEQQILLPVQEEVQHENPPTHEEEQQQNGADQQQSGGAEQQMSGAEGPPLEEIEKTPTDPKIAKRKVAKQEEVNKPPRKKKKASKEA